MQHPLNEKGEVLLQLRTDFNRWGIIGGALEYNETLEDALKREVFEETGLIIKNPELFRTYSGPDYFQIYPNGDQVHGVLVVYICREFYGELVCDQSESKELRFFSLDELPNRGCCKTKINIQCYESEKLAEHAIDSLDILIVLLYKRCLTSMEQENIFKWKHYQPDIIWTRIK
ncbi:phosphohydrolase (MutT/nudix family protein) [Bacillus thuringiensis Sbt003]|uniref:Phosphohydrolase (MutT/nudix family protein) n=3 Tax=Bacillus cereus group TaxID=86661 RepID=A0A9X0F6G4_BACTU|nr:phosphohydrolase (MutT/nudix family protein) [Bacillus thuringiensis Sbt003]